MNAANDDRPELSIEGCWELVAAGCNANEIAAYLGVSVSAAVAMIHHATRHYAEAA